MNESFEQDGITYNGSDIGWDDAEMLALECLGMERTLAGERVTEEHMVYSEKVAEAVFFGWVPDPRFGLASLSRQSVIWIKKYHPALWARWVRAATGQQAAQEKGES